MHHRAEIAQSYLNDFEITWKNLKQTKILDLGAGDASFGSEARKRNIFVVSIEINPEFYRREGLLRSTTLRKIPYIKGNMIQLPFRDETFDLIIAHSIGPIESFRSGVLIAADEKDFSDHNDEILRVLVPNGQHWVGPILKDQTTQAQAYCFYQKLYSQVDLCKVSTSCGEDSYLKMSK